ncbi:phage holin family protein [Pseudomonas sp. PD9R]|uniref:phage holin family protein n=1 Tax=Pseudomonas sp. PD9R TaxID=2853534 RepID=UPI001C493C2C|nr:phage holin family protein [Pseudomonas sp. PD9R]MBV6822497.1 pyocin R2, holin [Pseudomonas sp. PD9R]
MTIEQPVWLEIPLWMVTVLILLGGVAGEMWRADKEGVRGWSLFRRLALRSGSSMICGASAIMLLHAAGVSVWVACAGGCLTAMAGTDVVIGLYERWVTKQIGVAGGRPDDAEN